MDVVVVGYCWWWRCFYCFRWWCGSVAVVDIAVFVGVFDVVFCVVAVGVVSVVAVVAAAVLVGIVVL